MKTVRNEEESFNPLIEAQVGSRAASKGLKIEALTRKVTPLEENREKEILKNLKNEIRLSNMKGEINFSIEDIKELYESKKKLKNKKEVLHLENAHEETITSVAVTFDNKFIVSGSWDKSIKIFDIETKQQVHQFENAHENWVSSVAVTLNNEFIISGSWDKSIKVFNLASKQLVHHFKNAHQDGVTSVAVTSDLKYIVSGSHDRSVKIFDLNSKQQTHHFENIHHDGVTSVAVTSDGKYVISGSKDSSIKVFDLNTKQLVHHFDNIHDNGVTSVAVTADCKYLVSGSADKSIKVFDFETKLQLCHFENAHESGIPSIAVTPDNRFLLSGSWDESIKVFDLKTKQEVHHLKSAHANGVTCVAATPNSQYIISCSTDLSIKLFALNRKLEVCHFEKAHETVTNSVAITSDNKYIVSGASDKSVKVFELETRQLVCNFEEAHEQGISSVAVSPNNRYIISGSDDCSIKIFDLNTKQEVYHFENAHDLEIASVSVSHDSKYIVSGSWDMSIKVFDLETKQQVHHLENAHQDGVTSVAVTSDNKYIVSGSKDCSIKIFDLHAKQQVFHFENAHQDGVTCVAVTADSKYIVSGSYDRSIKIFDFYTRQQVFHFVDAHQDGITSLAVSADLKYIISGAFDKSIRVFDLNTKYEVHNFENAHEGGILSLAVSHDNKYIISGSVDQSIKVFKFQAQQIYEETREFSVFNSVDCFLFGKSTEYSVSEAIKHPEMFVLPFDWTILHIVSVYANHDFIAKMPDYNKFKMPFLVDALDRTPFHYLTAHKNVNFITVNIMFAYICDYLEDCQLRNPFEFQKIVQSLSPLLSFIFQNIEIKLRQRFLMIIYSKSSTPFNNPTPIFGNILSKSAIFCDSPVLTQETREQIWDDKGTTQVEFRSNYLNLDYNILSQDMQGLVDSLKAQKRQEIFRIPAIARLIDHLWRQAEIPLIIFFAFYSVFIIAVSVYLTLKDRSLPYEIVLLVISASLTLNEFTQIYHLKRSYLENLWNWFDLAHLLLTIAFLVTRIADDDNELARAWMSTIIVILGYVRWITLLKIFSPTRHLIQVVLTILRKMLSFIVVIALIIIGFSLIFLVFNREAGYGDYLYEAYSVLYGPMDIDEDAAWPFSQKLLMAVLAFFLNVVLLNLLISIMGDSYGQVLEMRDKTDALTRLEMISEAVVYRKFFQPNYQTKRGYLVYCLPVGLEEDRDDQNLELKLMRTEISTMKNEMSTKIERLEERILTLTELLKPKANAIVKE